MKDTGAIKRLLGSLQIQEPSKVEAEFEHESELILEVVNTSAQTYSFTGSEYEDAMRCLIKNRV